jgi:hypothetical protein
LSASVENESYAMWNELEQLLVAEGWDRTTDLRIMSPPLCH